MLHLVQSEQGYVTPGRHRVLRRHLGLTKAQVAAVVTFYTMYKRTPTGEYLVSVCTNTLCGMLGGDEIFAALSETARRRHERDDAPTARSPSSTPSAWPPATTRRSSPSTTSSSTTRPSTRARELVDAAAGRRAAAAHPRRAAVHVQADRAPDRRLLRRAAALALDANGTGVPTEVGVKLAIERGDTAPSYAIDATTEPTPAALTRPRRRRRDGASPRRRPVAPRSSRPARTTRR